MLSKQGTTLLLSSPNEWWKACNIYQIYPSSFLDSNGDGIGDLSGIHTRLDYIKDLGIDVIWLCPIYRSPQADMGYDISDYCDIDPMYGTLEDWDRLLHGIHDRGMKLMMDLVVNHSSDEHEWFVDSRSSKKSQKNDWYIWRPPKYDEHGNMQPPNNWKSHLQGSAWEYDSNREEYYLHLYLSKQPDLNWRNPDVREAVWDIMKFWLNRGCDGFRMDVINLISKVEDLPDAPITDPKEKYQLGSQYYANGPHVHEYLREMNEKVLSHYDVITVGQIRFTPSIEKLIEYVLPANKELNMVFQFELFDIDSMANGQDRNPFILRPWKLSEMKEIIDRWQQHNTQGRFWNTVFFENHDNARSISRFGNDSTDELRTLSGKLLATLQVTQGGTLFVYQGQELGMTNAPPSWGIEEYKGAAAQNYWKKMFEERKKKAGNGAVDMSDVLYGIQKKARDHSRLPMQWDTSSNAGFTTGTPWMRVNDDFKTWNVASQMQDENSMLSFWKRALKVRKEYPALIYGDFRLAVPLDDERIFGFTRSYQGVTILVLLNFSLDPVSVDFLEGERWKNRRYIMGNYPTSDIDATLRKYEGRLYVVE